MLVGVPPTLTLVAVPLTSELINGALGLPLICWMVDPPTLPLGWIQLWFSIGMTKTVETWPAPAAEPTANRTAHPNGATVAAVDFRVLTFPASKWPAASQ